MIGRDLKARLWSVKGFFLAGIVIGVIGLATELLTPNFHQRITMDIVQVLAPGCLFALFAILRNGLFARKRTATD
jgi:purine-cytosine permease-like protein